MVGDHDGLDGVRSCHVQRDAMSYNEICDSMFDIEVNQEQMSSEPVNIAVREHVCSLETEEWQYSQLGKELYVCARLFNERFFEGKLSDPILTIDKGRFSTMGSDRIGRNGFGAKNHITLNSLHVQSKAETLSTLLHEMIHLWQYEITRRASRPPYHNVEFQRKSRELGIPSDSLGHQLGMGDPFVSVCRENGVNVADSSDPPSVVGVDPRPSSKVKKYSCMCTNV